MKVEFTKDGNKITLGGETKEEVIVVEPQDQIAFVLPDANVDTIKQFSTMFEESQREKKTLFMCGNIRIIVMRQPILATKEG